MVGMGTSSIMGLGRRSQLNPVESLVQDLYSLVDIISWVPEMLSDWHCLQRSLPPAGPTVVLPCRASRFHPSRNLSVRSISELLTRWQQHRGLSRGLLVRRHYLSPLTSDLAKMKQLPSVGLSTLIPELKGNKVWAPEELCLPLLPQGTREHSLLQPACVCPPWTIAIAGAQGTPPGGLWGQPCIWTKQHLREDGRVIGSQSLALWFLW